jgi:hypothetical protein
LTQQSDASSWLRRIADINGIGQQAGQAVELLAEPLPVAIEKRMSGRALSNELSSRKLLMAYHGIRYPHLDIGETRQ